MRIKRIRQRRRKWGEEGWRRKEEKNGKNYEGERMRRIKRGGGEYGRRTMREIIRRRRR